jgi:hypothetical protein
VKGAYIPADLEFLGGSNLWNVRFARAVHDWEMDVFASFFKVLHLGSVRRGCEDQLRWAPYQRGLFKGKSFYYSLASPEGSCFP